MSAAWETFLWKIYPRTLPVGPEQPPLRHVRDFVTLERTPPGGPAASRQPPATSQGQGGVERKQPWQRADSPGVAGVPTSPSSRKSQLHLQRLGHPPVQTCPHCP